MAVRDPKTEWLRVQIYRNIRNIRNMTPQQRILIAAQLYEDGVDTVCSAILDRHPNTPQKSWNGKFDVAFCHVTFSKSRSSTCTTE